MQCVPAATRSWAASHGLLLARRGGALASSPSPRQPPRLLPFLLYNNNRNPRPYPRLFASIPESYNPSSSSSSNGSGAAGSSEELVTIGPRMPAELEPRPKPTTAQETVALYVEKLWRDFFTNPYMWMDNRLRRREKKYADFKHRATKEGLWITASLNPPWVRVELSLMTHFRPVPFNDPIWSEGENAKKGESRLAGSPSTPSSTRMGQSQVSVTSRSSYATSGQTRSEVWRKNENAHATTPSGTDPRQ